MLSEKDQKILTDAVSELIKKLDLASQVRIKNEDFQHLFLELRKRFFWLTRPCTDNKLFEYLVEIFQIITKGWYQCSSASARSFSQECIDCLTRTLAEIDVFSIEFIRDKMDEHPDLISIFYKVVEIRNQALYKKAAELREQAQLIQKAFDDNSERTKKTLEAFREFEEKRQRKYLAIFEMQLSIKNPIVNALCDLKKELESYQSYLTDQKSKLDTKKKKLALEKQKLTERINKLKDEFTQAERELRDKQEITERIIDELHRIKNTDCDDNDLYRETEIVIGELNAITPTDIKYYQFFHQHKLAKYNSIVKKSQPDINKLTLKIEKIESRIAWLLTELRATQQALNQIKEALTLPGKDLSNENKVSFTKVRLFRPLAFKPLLNSIGILQHADQLPKLHSFFPREMPNVLKFIISDYLFFSKISPGLNLEDLRRRGAKELYDYEESLYAEDKVSQLKRIS